jgi:hypothetical protein
MRGFQGVLGPVLAFALLAAALPASATFTTPPTATIAHWHGNATAAYSLLHDDVCDGSKGPPAHGTYGLFDYWQEAANRGVRVGFGAIARECLDQPEKLTFLKSTIAAGYELFSHSYFHCDHTQEPSACMVWDDNANGGAGGEVPLTTLHPEIDTRQKLIDYEMTQSKALFEDAAYTGVGVNFYAFPYDIFDSLALSRLGPAGYLGARGGNRATGNINTWNINPDPAQGGDAAIDFHVKWDEYNANDVPGSPTNTSDYDPPSLTNYMNDVVSGGLGGWGVQVLHGIEDASFGTIALDVYRNLLDTLVAQQNQGQLWLATPTEAIRYRRTNYHCGGARNGNDAVVTVDSNGNVSFAGLGDPLCPQYATEVTIVVTLPAGVSAITATQNGLPIGVMADDTPGNVLINANPVLGTINLQPATSPTPPAITSAATKAFTVNASDTFTITASGHPAPTFSITGTLPGGIVLDPVSGVLSGRPTAAGSYVRTITAANGVPPDATQSFTLVVNKGDQVIAFVPIAELNVTEVESIVASATSRLAVTFASATPGVCSVSNSDVTVTGLAPGTCTIQAAQAGSADWNPAPVATMTFFVKGGQTIAFGAVPSVVVGGTGTVNATASSGLPVELISWIPSTCTVSGNVVTGLAAGDCPIAANQAGNDFYHPASEVVQVITIGKGSQAISFGAAPALVVGGVGTLAATATSGLPVVFASKSPATCSVSGATVTGLAAGSCTVSANQGGDADYNAAPEATQTLSVGANAGTFSLVVTKSGDGSGSITSAPAGIDCGPSCAANFTAGTNVVLQAVPDAGSVFVGWVGACSGTGPCNISMNAAKSVAAAFSLPASVGRVINISTRGHVGTGEGVMIGGFVIAGSTPKTVIVRGIGPSLAAFGVTGTLSNPRLDLYSGNTIIASNDDWGSADNATAIQASGFAPSDARESAILITLNPGAYTAIVTGVGNATGVGMVEVYETDATQGPLINISTRAQVLPGDDVLIGGFVISGNSPRTVVITARGPSLAPYGIANPLSDPAVFLFSGQTLFGANDNWQDAPNAAQIAASGFAPSNPSESAMLLTLFPGVYTVVVTGAGGASGVGIVEVFVP